MIVPDEERAWIEKYREAMDARAVVGSRPGRIRTAWSHITLAAVSATHTIVRRASSLRASPPPTWASESTAAERAESMNHSSALEQDQRNGGSFTCDEAENSVVDSFAREGEIGVESGRDSVPNELIHME
jgi:hypothetical protein